MFDEDRNEESFNEEESSDEQNDIMVSDTVHTDPSQLPTVEELSATIKELSDTLVNISANAPFEPSANELPTMSELSTAIQELSSTVLQMSTSNLSTSDVPVTQAIQSSMVDAQPEFAQSTSSSETTNWCGFKLVGDNIDKNFRRSFHRHDKMTISMHAFHFYAVKDRVDLSSLSDFKPTPATVDVSKLLINKADVNQLNKEVIVLLSRSVT